MKRPKRPRFSMSSPPSQDVHFSPVFVSPTSLTVPGVVTVYLSVPDPAPIEQALAGYATVVARRDTGHGVRELIVRDPSGHFVFFGQRLEPSPS